MDFSLTGSGYLLPMVIIGIVIIVVIAAVLFQIRSKKRSSPRGDTELSPYSPRHPLDYQPQSKPIPVIQPSVIPAPRALAADVAKPKEIDLTKARKDMTESLDALVRKYSLNNFTIATADGLVFGSSMGDTAQADAATYSEMFKNDPLTETRGVVLFGITYKGSELIGIVRAKTPPPNEIMQQIAADTKVILNWWI
jgi:hypothetical protein